ncbi:MAG: hypothetical protein IJL74_02770 [Bacilli bacterium]|nr:hypothetical protein [Bacilli bacterium]
MKINEKLIPSIASFYNNGGNGYIRFNNGFQICWLTKTSQQLGGNAWGNVYYSDHSMGNWVSSFTNCYAVWPSLQTLQYWSTCADWNTTSAGKIRVFRPNNSKATETLRIIGIGNWK